MILSLSLAFASPVSDALAARDGVDCMSLGDPSPALRDELLALTDPAILPPSVPMRAASCLAERFGTESVVQDAIVAWSTDSERQGLAMAALLRVDLLGEPGAVRVIQAALASPLPRVATKAREMVPGSVHPAVRGL
ncbi:MAG: hypothetical protein FJ102_13510 [Deltaproteobacteria bacterium]|nr:hypothetical protein [Deltaproteobacteria bacterium]